MNCLLSAQAAPKRNLEVTEQATQTNRRVSARVSSQRQCPSPSRPDTDRTDPLKLSDSHPPDCIIIQFVIMPSTKGPIFRMFSPSAKTKEENVEKRREQVRRAQQFVLSPIFFSLVAVEHTLAFTALPASLLTNIADVKRLSATKDALRQVPGG